MWAKGAHNSVNNEGLAASYQLPLGPLINQQLIVYSSILIRSLSPNRPNLLFPLCLDQFCYVNEYYR